MDFLTSSLETVFKEKHGVWDPMPELTVKLTLSQSQLRSYSAIHPHYKEKGVERGRSLLLVELICVCLLVYKTTNRKIERGEGMGKS